LESIDRRVPELLAQDEEARVCGAELCAMPGIAGKDIRRSLRPPAIEAELVD
jgi:hypothetical protein